MRKWLLPMLLLLVVAALGGWGLVRWGAGLLQPVAPGAQNVVSFEVPPGASTREVAEALAARGLIRHPLAFRVYARRRNLDGQIRPGEYRLGPGMDVAAILDKLTRGETVVYRFTIPEGFTVAQVAELLARQGVVDRERFLAAARASTLNREWLPPGAPVREPLEGYLFPFTYEYRPGVTPEAILALMVERLRTTLKPAYLQRAAELKLSVHQLLTLAAIVEREARLPGERARIAGVYWNRLRRDMRLDADPTVAYALNKSGEELSRQDLEVDDPYNTYRYKGLPPGPIANPGEAAIQAVLWPEEHNYLFFVARAGGQGEHLFSVTLAEHEEKVAAQRRP